MHPNLPRRSPDSFRSHNLSRHVARHSLQLIRRLGPVEVPIRDRGTVLNDFQGESVQSVNAGTQMPEHWPSVHLVSLSFNTGDTGYRPRLYSSVLICERRRPGASTGAFAPVAEIHSPDLRSEGRSGRRPTKNPALMHPSAVPCLDPDIPRSTHPSHSVHVRAASIPMAGSLTRKRMSEEVVAPKTLNKDCDLAKLTMYGRPCRSTCIESAKYISEPRFYTHHVRLFDAKHHIQRSCSRHFRSESTRMRWHVSI